MFTHLLVGVCFCVLDICSHADDRWARLKGVGTFPSVPGFPFCLHSVFQKTFLKFLCNGWLKIDSFSAVRNCHFQAPSSFEQSFYFLFRVSLTQKFKLLLNYWFMYSFTHLWLGSQSVCKSWGRWQLGNLCPNSDKFWQFCLYFAIYTCLYYFLDSTHKWYSICLSLTYFTKYNIL